MRLKNDKETHNNIQSINNISWSLSKLINLKNTQFKYIVRMYYLCILHELSNKSIDNSINFDDIQIEIPYIGCIHLSCSENNVEFKSIELEEEFKEDLNKAINLGESSLENEIMDKYNERIIARYKELI